MTARDLDSPCLPASTARYEYRALLGRGGGGSVWAAWDRQLHREVAIKRLPLAEGDERALREARLGADPGHAAFVAVHEVFTDGDVGCIVMERVHGRTLSELLQHGPVDEARARRWTAEAADALAQAHARGIVHGDLQPGNIMLADDGRLRLLDFGIARSLDPHRTMDGAALGEQAAGTLRYMAPELLLGGAPSVASDVHALGLVLMEMLGHRPFAGAEGLAIAHRKLHGDGPVPQAGAAPPGVPADLWSLALAMTRRDPAQRPPSMGAVAASLASAAPSSPSATPPAARRWRRLSGPARWAGVALAGLLLLGGGNVAWQRLVTAGSPAWTLERLDRAQALLQHFDDPDSLASAIALLEGVLSRQPRHAAAAALLAIADCLANAGDATDPAWLQRADVSSRMAVQADDQLALSHVARAWYLEAAHRDAEAEAAYRRALLLDPTDAYGQLGLARLLTRQHRGDEARRTLDAALAGHPADALLHDALGTLRYQEGDYRGAEQSFRRAVQLRPESPVGYANLDAALLRLGRDDEALAVLQQGLRARPDGRLYGNLGTALFARGRYAEAAEAFERALSSDKGNPNDYLKWANLGDALHWVPGRDDQAHAAWRHALDLLQSEMRTAPGPADITRRSRAGLYAARLGDVAASRGWTASALREAPGSPDVLYRAALAAELTGDRATAIDRLRQALSHGFPRASIEQEPDLQALRRDHAYHQLFTPDLP